MIIYTIGHSTRTIQEFVETLQAYSILQLVDIRTMPRSRHNPQFNRDIISQSLAEAGINYAYMDSLGGLRKTSSHSINTGWHNASFRGYADYMQTDEFATGIAELIEIAKHNLTAIMCAEAVPWRCHRSLVGDALLVRGVEVIDIFSSTKSKPEKITGIARVEGDTITYPDAETD